MEGLLAIIIVSLFGLWIWNLKQDVVDLNKRLAGAAHGKTHGPTGTGDTHHQHAAPARSTSNGTSAQFNPLGDNMVWVIRK